MVHKIKKHSRRHKRRTRRHKRHTRRHKRHTRRHKRRTRRHKRHTRRHKRRRRRRTVRQRGGVALDGTLFAGARAGTNTNYKYTLANGPAYGNNPPTAAECLPSGNDGVSDGIPWAGQMMAFGATSATRTGVSPFATAGCG